MFIKINPSVTRVWGHTLLFAPDSVTWITSILIFEKLSVALAPLTEGFKRDNGRILSLLIIYFVSYHEKGSIITTRQNVSMLTSENKRNSEVTKLIPAESSEATNRMIFIQKLCNDFEPEYNNQRNVSKLLSKVANLELDIFQC